MTTKTAAHNRNLRWRIFASFILLLLGLQGATLFLMYKGFEANFEKESIERLQTGKTIFNSDLESRNEFLIANVTTISKDWGLRSALGQGDQATLHSALLNHSSRVKADIAMVIGLDGEVMASVGQRHMATGNQSIQGAVRGDEIFSQVVLDGEQAYQVVFAPVKAPVSIGWVALGFSINHELAQYFKDLASLEVSFLELSNAKPRVVATTLNDAQLSGVSNLAKETLLNTQEVVKVSRGNLNVLQYSIALSAVEGTEVYALIQQPLDELQEIFWARSLSLTAVFLVGTLIAGMVAFLLARSVSRPLQQLIQVVGNVGRGQYEAIDEKGSYQEIDQLANEFNRMQLAISLREKEIRYRADYDELTGLYNRHSFIREVEARIATSELQANESLKIMILDLVRFKEVIDVLGYDVGDMLIKAVGERLVKTLDNDYIIARFNSEFVLCNRSACPQKATDCTNLINAVFEQPFEVEGVSLQVTANIGVSLYPEHEQTAPALLRLANVALDVAKRKNVDAFVYQQSEDSSSLLRLKIVADMRRALDENELILNYQPKIEMNHAGGQPVMTQVESLVRWIHPEHGFIPPDEFIPIAEQTGSIVYLTQWVLKAALQQCQRWRERDIYLQVAVNISAVDLQCHSIVRYIDELLTEFDLPAEVLVLEITESAVVDNPEQAIEILDELKSRGIKLSIDDYGTGYSSLAQLKKLPVDELKIDKSFVLDMENDEDDDKIVRSTIQLSHSMGLRVTAEGVETEKAMTMLADYGCDYAQGYFISKPLPAEQFDQWLTETEFQLLTNAKLAS